MASRLKKRVIKEVSALLRGDSLSAGIMAYTQASTPDNLRHLDVFIKGPKGTEFDGAVFRLKLEVVPEYPVKPPKITFVTKVYHPNIYGNGDICLSILSSSNRTNGWSAALSLEKALLSVLVLLTTEAEPGDAANGAAATLYTSKRKEYNAKQQADGRVSFAAFQSYLAERGFENPFLSKGDKVEDGAGLGEKKGIAVPASSKTDGELPPKRRRK